MQTTQHTFYAQSLAKGRTFFDAHLLVEVDMRDKMSLISLLWLTSLPLFVLSATCPSPTASGVQWDAATGRVTWAASAGALRCVRGYQVCWAAVGTTSSRQSCELVSTAAGGANLSGLAPCQNFLASITAVNWNGLTSAPSSLRRTTGAPQITTVSMTQLDPNTTVLTWPTMSSYSCVKGINFSLCDSSGCWNSSLSSDMSSLELTELVQCRVYYLRIGTVGVGPTFTPKTFRIQLGALNVLASAKARNVTHQSANIWWLVSGARNVSCSSRRLRLCYKASGGQASAVCNSIDLGQTSASGSMTLQRLDTCTAYIAVLRLDTRSANNNRTVSFVTPLTVGSLRMAVREVTSSSALVVWSVHANRTDCGPANVVLCLSRADNSSSPKCGGRWQGLAASSRLVGLQACTDYRVHLVVMTHTRPWPIRTQRLVTASQGSKKALASVKLSATRDRIDVTWVVANSSAGCVHGFNVTWSAAGGGGGWSAVDQRWDNFTISPVTAGLLYSVGVEAQLVGGTSYKLSSWVTTSGSTRNFSTSINVLPMLIVIAFIFSSEIK
ncbi:uncharacterized protein LOC134536879 isoform X2 [Bacillus rossius redtenbacheri]|uniref:uncharacterized protein LOC134536879 isoform X2 n=1 Tax=Bacillus rossius redtenbacheri TaxID=93214 RepID=UPI002FDF06F4